MSRASPEQQQLPLRNVSSLQHIKIFRLTSISRSAIFMVLINRDTDIYADYWFLTSVVKLLVTNIKKNEILQFISIYFRRWNDEPIDMEICRRGHFGGLNCCKLHQLSIWATIEAIISLQIGGRVNRPIKPYTWQSGEKNVILRWPPSFGIRM